MTGNDERKRIEAAPRADGPGRGNQQPATGNPSSAVDAYTAAQDAQDAAAAHSQRTFRIWRGADGKGEFQEFKADVVEGMVVLDAVHEIQASQANDLAVRWNCKAGKCGSCSAEVNGMP